SETVSILTPNRVPQIAAIANVVLKNNESVAVNVTAIDDAADHITLTATGLPPFATFTDNGNGTGVINIVPSSGAIGYYPGIKITASDNLDSARSAMFDITVVDKDISSVYINFSDGVFTGKRPWNNFSQWPLAGSAMSGLLDDGNANSGMNITILDNMDILNRGMIPGNGETIYPDSVMRTSLYDQSTSTKRIRLSGLSTSRRYNVVFFASHDFGLKCLTNFTINGTTVSLDATYNMNKTVQINGIVPNASGEIVINIAKAAGNDLAILTSLVVQSYASSVTLLSPTDLRVTGIASNSLKLQWADRASDETGFQVWRATDTLNSSFALVATLAANATSYTDNNLKANRTYYYTVRAVKSGQFSAYCNMAQATTYASNVYINFTGVNDVGSPWNNTHAAPVAGALWSGFKNEAGQTTSTGMEIIDAFSEVHPLGMVTGNNSGYYPDDLLMYSYYVFPGITAKVKVKGLNVAHRYDFTFVGSSAGFGDLRSAYIINGKTYYLNAALNLGYGRLVVHDIQPDENGEVEISIHRGSSQSPGGYLNAMIISGVSKPAFATPVLPGSAPQSMGMPSAMPGQDTAATAGRRSAEVAAANTQEITIEKGYINAYPNPFYNAFNVVFDAEDGERAVITVFNQAGQNVYLNNVAGTVGGRNQVRIQPGNGMSKPGTYIVRVELLGRDNKMRVKTLKLVKL
ncbi:MAG TPA: fibronectin type III domain-containing protein, partial [Chitinophagaceae bacterium]|nr:fibronectin type III domain-containing protein [Chitinophagaceae bacterium]